MYMATNNQIEFSVSDDRAQDTENVSGLAATTVTSEINSRRDRLAMVDCNAWIYDHFVTLLNLTQGFKHIPIELCYPSQAPVSLGNEHQNTHRITCSSSQPNRSEPLYATTVETNGNVSVAK